MTKPIVVIVDDEPELTASSLAQELNSNDKVDAHVFAPGDVTAELLAEASLVLIDYRIEVWAARAKQTEVGLQPKNGLALAGVLREYCDRDATAIALLSNQLGDLYGPLSPDNRRHVLARVTSLEWVFDKSDAAKIRQIEILADGMQSIRSLVKNQNLTTLAAFFPAEQRDLFNDAAESSIDRCLPPVNELAKLTHGSAFARWFLQRVLPYPSFLIDSNHIAARLGVTPKSLSKAIVIENDLSKALGEIQYGGVFKDFLGPRWYRSALEDWLWDVTKGQSFDTQEVDDALERCSNGVLEKTSARPDPVVLVGDNYESTENLHPRQDSIAVFPDDWPAYAERAYLKLDDVRSEKSLRNLVMHDEKWRLEGNV